MKTMGLSMICAGLAFLMLSYLLPASTVAWGVTLGGQYSIKYNRYGCDHAFLKNPSI